MFAFYEAPHTYIYIYVYSLAKKTIPQQGVTMHELSVKVANFQKRGSCELPATVWGVKDILLFKKPCCRNTPIPAFYELWNV